MCSVAPHQPHRTARQHCALDSHGHTRSLHTGIGEIGKEAYAFIDFLEAAHMQIWQMLPLVPPGRPIPGVREDYWSPYSGQDASAGFPLLIELQVRSAPRPALRTLCDTAQRNARPRLVRVREPREVLCVCVCVCVCVCWCDVTIHPPPGHHFHRVVIATKRQWDPWGVELEIGAKRWLSSRGAWRGWNESAGLSGRGLAGGLGPASAVLPAQRGLGVCGEGEGASVG